MTAHDVEAVMAYLDGELPTDAAERMQVHLDECEECRTMMTELRGVSERLGAWQVEGAPTTLRPRARWSVRSLSLLAAAAGVVLAVALGSAVFRPERSDKSAPRESATAELTPEAPPAASARATIGEHVEGQALVMDQAASKAGTESAQPGGPLIVRAITLTITVRDFDASRSALDRIARDAGGYIGNLTSRGPRGGVPALHATLRVPAARLDEAIAALKQLGSVTSETQSNDDVTQ
ncbi:MAG: DUF4349 domain-containing protein, partial [Acidobacteria bacterium]|nr:DUF4349 domain-containing protein [Acidobacteriota bacterium]